MFSQVFLLFQAVPWEDKELCRLLSGWVFNSLSLLF